MRPQGGAGSPQGSGEKAGSPVIPMDETTKGAVDDREGRC